MKKQTNITNNLKKILQNFSAIALKAVYLVGGLVITKNPAQLAAAVYEVYKCTESIVSGCKEYNEYIRLKQIVDSIEFNNNYSESNNTNDFSYYDYCQSEHMQRD